MVDNTISKFCQSVQKIIIYRPPTNPDPFVLDEKRPFDDRLAERPEPATNQAQQAFTRMLRFAGRLETFAIKLAGALQAGAGKEQYSNLKRELAALEKQFADLTPVLVGYDQSEPRLSTQRLSTSLEENRQKLESIYKLPLNKDIVIREIQIAASPPVKAMAVFVDGLVDSRALNLSVLEPLMLIDGTRDLYATDLVEQIIGECLPNNQAKPGNTFAAVEEAVNSGDTALIFDGVDVAVLVNTKGWQHRGVEHPQTEQSVRGSLAAFSENLRINTGLIRTMIRASDLVTEMVKVGRRSRVNCALMYIESIANPRLVAEVRRRIKLIRTDYIGDSGQLIQFIEDHPGIPFPQSLSTERPDRVAAHLAEGRVAVILEGNPFVHVVPATFFAFFHSSEDFSIKPTVSNFTRVIRLFGALIATVMPSLYLAVSYFHQEALPTGLLLAIAGSRESVPFPAWFEIAVMEISFELIREAGIRIPGVLGSTIGIVGAIILGQAAVTARLVSPIIVVIIAITGLASFTIPEYRMSSALRLTRFILLVFASLLGLVGLATFLLWIILLFCRMKSFGVPYMTPLAPRVTAGYDAVLRGPVYRQEQRPDELNPRDRKRQPTISRLWKKKRPVGDDESSNEV